MRFSVQVVRLSLVTQREFTFAQPAANQLRGILGLQFRKHSEAAYQEFFAPVAAAGPSGFADPPRPFALRAAHLDGINVARGQAFHFDVHLFDLERGWIPVLEEALKTAGPANLQSVVAQPVLNLDLASSAHPIPRLRVRFVTPMELKAQGKIVATPDFGTLAARARDRISSLSAIYGEGPLSLDHAAFGERARAIELARCEIQHVAARRRSSRTGQTHSLGGFTGEAEYTGALAEFFPFLRAAQWTGMGRQTTWGKGVIAIEEPVV